jgi:hypothetical protein
MLPDKIIRNEPKLFQGHFEVVDDAQVKKWCLTSVNASRAQEETHSPLFSNN